ncbi:MAG: anthranilate synthase component I [Candidatus Epulonipiscium fishelsonii]|nr:MAG: anthranilate synthase component I [Epulopiscium sp. AS2M-Bin002]
MIDIISQYKEEYKMYPVSCEILSDFTTPINVLKKLASISNDFYLLESVESEESIGRYSFLGFDPILNIKYKDNITTICSGEMETQSTEDVFGILRGYVDKYKSPKIDGLPPFTGGFVGYMSYEMIKYFEPKLDIPLNDYNDFELQLFDKVIVFDNLKKKIIIIVNMKLDDCNKQYEKALLEIKKIVELIKCSDNVGSMKLENPIRFKSNLSKDEYLGMVDRAKEHIVSGDIFQVVLSRRFEADFKSSLINSYRMLRTSNPSPYMYFIKNGDLEICGASPETLVKVVDKKVTTFPVAGTRPRGKNHSEDIKLEMELLSDEKELAEHNMLVDLARNDVGKVSKFSSVKVDEYLQIHRYSKVMHIASVVSGELRDKYDAFDAIKAILPAGTLSGAPKFRACEIIAKLEGTSRGVYGGAIGYIDLTGNMDMCIAIRTAISDGNKVYVQAGAGVVYDSVAENEYDECEKKASAVINAVKESFNII